MNQELNPPEKEIAKIKSLHENMSEPYKSNFSKAVIRKVSLIYMNQINKKVGAKPHAGWTENMEQIYIKKEGFKKNWDEAIKELSQNFPNLIRPDAQTLLSILEETLKESLPPESNPIN